MTDGVVPSAVRPRSYFLLTPRYLKWTSCRLRKQLTPEQKLCENEAKASPFEPKAAREKVRTHGETESVLDLARSQSILALLGCKLTKFPVLVNLGNSMTKAVIVMPANGRYPSYGIDKLNSCNQHNLVLLEDSAQCLGSRHALIPALMPKNLGHAYR